MIETSKSNDVLLHTDFPELELYASGMPNARSMALTAKVDEEAPYLAVVLVPGWGDRA